MADNTLTADNGDTFPVSVTISNNKNPKVFQLVNGLDVEATFTFRGTYNADSASAADAVELGSTTVASSSTDWEGLTEEWDQLELEIDATSPASGQADIYTHEGKKV